MPDHAAAVRHLRWLCHAPQLLQSALTFNPGDYLPADFQDILYHWDENPRSGPAVLTDTPHYRLGIYFEKLYACLITDILGWEMLARNFAVRANGRTLGELDFLVRNTQTGVVEHHEIAVKFYLGYLHPLTAQTRWHGPNPADRLDLKTAHLLNHQTRLTDRTETIAALQQQDLPLPSAKRIFMPGYLFYPESPPLVPPSYVPANHLQGQWCHVSQVDDTRSRNWVALHKPHWLGPWCQTDTPDTIESSAVLRDVREKQIPRLFAELAWQQASNDWREVSRIFVVPDQWPQDSSSTTFNT